MISYISTITIWFRIQTQTQFQMCNQEKPNMIVLWLVFFMKTHDNRFNPVAAFTNMDYL